MHRTIDLKAVTTRAVALAVGLVMVLVNSGCGLFGGDRHAGFVETMLGQLPDTKANRVQIFMSDRASDRRFVAFLQPHLSDLSDKRLDYFRLFFGQWGRSSASNPYAPRLAGGGVPIPPFARSELPIHLVATSEFPIPAFGESSSEDERRELGFAATDVDQELFAGSVPHSVEILRSEHIGADDIDRAVHADPVWKSSLQARTHEGERFYTWIDDAAAAAKADHKRRSVTGMSRSRGLAADGRQVRLANAYGDVEASIDAGHGKAKSLADDDTLRSMAQVLDDHHAYNVFLSADPSRFTLRRFFGPGGGSDQTRRGLALARKQALRPWRALAVGDSVQDNRRVGLIVIANADADIAKANASQLRRVLEQGRPLLAGRLRRSFANIRYRDLFKIESITTQGSLAVAVVSAGFNTELIRMTLQGEPLLAHD